MNRLEVAVASLNDAIEFLDTCSISGVHELLKDLRGMIPEICKFAREYPLQVYSSGLEWFPTTSKLREVYFTPDSRYVLSGLDKHQRIKRVDTHPDACGSVALSPDGRFVIWPTSGHTIQMRTVGGKRHASFGQHEDWIMSLSFSSNGQQVVARSTSDIKQVELKAAHAALTSSLWAVVVSSSSPLAG
ncbi:hypothetical protein B0H11DRAFT_1907311 [Mycena galericulata]|nr:hypothetical protein B0H11DRAFT_1907311 [Mycena galericulata]